MKPNKNNTLSYEQKIKLSVWASNNPDAFSGKSEKQCAELASKELGFLVTDRNIQPIRGALYPNTRPCRSGGNPPIAMVDAIHRKVDAAIERLAKLESDLGVKSEAKAAE